MNGVILFMTFDKCNETLKKYEPHSQLNDNNHWCYYKSSSYFLSGALGGFFQSFIASPMASTKLFLSSYIDTALKHESIPNEAIKSIEKYRNKGIIHHFSTVFKQGGLPVLYHGFPISIIKESLGFGFFFSVFESSKHYTSKGVNYLFDKAKTHRDINFNKKEKKSLFHRFCLGTGVVVSGGLAGISYTLITYPLTVYRTHLLHDRFQIALKEVSKRSHGKGREVRLSNHLRTFIPKSKGWWKGSYQMSVLGLYKGIGSAIVRVLPGSALGKNFNFLFLFFFVLLKNYKFI